MPAVSEYRFIFCEANWVFDRIWQELFAPAIIFTFCIIRLSNGGHFFAYVNPLLRA